MSIACVEGFDHYQASLAQAKGWNGVWTSMQTGRLAGFCARLNSGTTGASRGKGLPSTYTTLYMGLAFRFGSGVGGVGGSITYEMFGFRAGGTNIVRLSVDPSGHLNVRNSADTVIATGTAVLAANIWYYVELKGVINGASGSCQVWLNGVQEIAATTGNFGSSAITSLYVSSTARGSGGTLDVDYDDLYVSTSGQLGDVRVETIAPIAEGNSSSWTPSTGTDNSANVDEMSGTYPNDDTDYNSTSNAGDKDTFDMGALSGQAGQIYAIQPSIYARKDDAGTRTVAPVIRHSGTDYDGTSQGVSASYAYYSQIYEAMPNADPLTKARVDAAEYGVKLVA